MKGKNNLKIKNALKWIVVHPMELLGAAALAASVLISTMNALGRYMFSWVWNPSTDLNMIFFCYTVFFGAAVAYKEKKHYGVKLLVNKLPEKIRFSVEMIVHLVCIAALAYGTYLSCYLFSHVGGKALANTGISYKWYDLAAVIGLGYMCYYEIVQTVKDVKLTLRHEARQEVEREADV